MGLIRHDQDVMIWQDWCDIRPIELLDQCEDKARIALELLDQVFPVRRHEL